jgi:hypothetical protein
MQDVYVCVELRYALYHFFGVAQALDVRGRWRDAAVQLAVMVMHALRQ